MTFRCRIFHKKKSPHWAPGSCGLLWGKTYDSDEWCSAPQIEIIRVSEVFNPIVNNAPCLFSKWFLYMDMTDMTLFRLDLDQLQIYQDLRNLQQNEVLFWRFKAYYQQLSQMAEAGQRCVRQQHWIFVGHRLALKFPALAPFGPCILEVLVPWKLIGFWQSKSWKQLKDKGSEDKNGSGSKLKDFLWEWGEPFLYELLPSALNSWGLGNWPSSSAWASSCHPHPHCLGSEPYERGGLQRTGKELGFFQEFLKVPDFGRNLYNPFRMLCLSFSWLMKTRFWKVLLFHGCKWDSLFGILRSLASISSAAVWEMLHERTPLKTPIGKIIKT